MCADDTEVVPPASRFAGRLGDAKGSANGGTGSVRSARVGASLSCDGSARNRLQAGIYDKAATPRAGSELRETYPRASGRLIRIVVPVGPVDTSAISP